MEALGRLRYLKGTRELKLVFGVSDSLHASQNEVRVMGYSDRDFGNCPETRHSTTGFVLTINGNPFLWASRKQPYVVKSTCAAQFPAASAAADEIMLTMKIFVDVGNTICPVALCVDN
jgi:hypothetical protein